MKKKANRDLILFIIFIPVFLATTFYISNRINNQLPSYSVINKSDMGCSVFYEALGKLNYPVDRALKPVETQNTEDMQIVVQGGSFDVNSADIKRWIEKGGILIYLATDNNAFVKYGTRTSAPNGVAVYNYGRGKVITYKVSLITNRSLITKTEGGYTLLQYIDSHSYKTIYFNESNLFEAANKVSLWDYIPLELKFILFQLLIIIFAFFYYKGKRFGKPVPLYEEVERNENEYLYTAASLYRHASCWDIMLENYYKSFLKLLKPHDEDWFEYWEKEKLPYLSKAKRVFDFMQPSGKKASAKEYIQVISAIEQLKSILMKRRDSYWKVLKRTQ